MASPGELVNAVAQVLGVPIATVIVHDRNLVMAGLRTKGGRGRSAAKITSQDVSALLIAVAASSIVKDSAKIWHDYVGLPINDTESVAGLMTDIPLSALSLLDNEHTFGQILTALVDSAGDGSMQELIRGNPGRSFHSGLSFSIDHPPEISVRLRGPVPRAEIGVHIGRYSISNHYGGPPTFIDKGGELNTDCVAGWEADALRRYGPGDLKQTREFSMKTILAMGELLKS